MPSRPSSWVHNRAPLKGENAPRKDDGNPIMYFRDRPRNMLVQIIS